MANVKVGASIFTKYQQGLGTMYERMIILVDIEKLMSSRDMELIETAEEMAASWVGSGFQLANQSELKRGEQSCHS